MHASVNDAINRLRAVGIAEGVSYLVLLLVAMPLKYLAGIAMAVKVVGWIHGVLFMAYVYVLVAAWSQAGWPLRRVVTLFVSALLPFGPFIHDKGLKREAEAA